MTGQHETDGKVIRLSFARTSETKRANERGQPADYSLSPTKKKASRSKLTAKTDEPISDPVMTYVNKLLRKRPGKDRRVSWQEYAKILSAIKPLQLLLPYVDTDTVLDVMEEYNEDPKPTVSRIAKNEEALWLDAAVREEPLIPHFDFRTAHANFKVPPEQRTSRVVFIKDEFARPVEPPEVPLKLVKGERYFFIVLRMYRRQYEKDFAKAAKPRAHDRLP